MRKGTSEGYNVLQRRHSRRVFVHLCLRSSERKEKPFGGSNDQLGHRWYSFWEIYYLL